MDMDVTSSIEIVNHAQVVRMEHVSRLARENGLSTKAVELFLLDKGITPYRYSGNTRTIGTDGQARLLRSTVTIIGCGGLGGAITEICARTGIGRIKLVDGDRFEESNLNRQLISTEDLIGQSKAECAKDRVNRINSGIEAEAFHVVMSQENVVDLIRDADCVIDALDNVPSRFILQDACRNQGIPLVHGAIGNMDAQVTSIFPGEDSFDQLYIREQQRSAQTPMGNPAVSVFLCAALEVSEAMKLILGIGEPLKNRLLRFDLLRDELIIFPINS